MVRRTPDLTLRRVVLPRGPSPIAARYNVRSIPHLLLYDKGRLVATGTTAVLARLR